MTLPWHFSWDGTRYQRSPEQMTEELAHKLGMMVPNSGLALVLMFGWDRKGGQQHCPALKAFAEAIAAKVQTPSLRPGEQPKPVIVAPSPPKAIPRVVPSQPKQPKLTWRELWNLIKARKKAA